MRGDIESGCRVGSLRHSVEHTPWCRWKREGHQQPDGHQQPQSILQVQIDPAPQQITQQAQNQNQNAGGKQDLFYFAPSSALRRMAYSSSISACVRASRWANVLTNNPTLP